MARVPMTKSGFDKLVEELDRFRRVELPAIIEKVAEARSHGDLKENAEYHAARERQGQIQDKIRYLESRIADAQIIETEVNSDEIRFGSKVICCEIDDEDEKEEYVLVGADEANPSQGMVSVTSPLGQAFLGKKAGDIVEVAAPAGKYKLKIVSFE
ncbi:MAG: transcription elongation factor GreA [Chitinispirillales bacterium]|nr:transcription elongation factor GreA [Chitinispirillales bacterium]